MRMDDDALPGSADAVLLWVDEADDDCTVLDPAAGVVGAEELAAGASLSGPES